MSNKQSKEQIKVLQEAQGVNTIKKTRIEWGKFDENRRRDFIGASVVQWFDHSPFTSKVAGSILRQDF